MDFLIVDGEILAQNEVNLTSIFQNQPFPLTQKIWFGFGGIPLFSENLKLLRKQASALKLELPAIFSNNRELFRITKRMLNKNKFYRSGYVKFEILQKRTSTNFIITSQAFSGFDFPFAEKGILLGVSAQFKNSKTPFSQFPFYNEIIWKVARAEIKGTQLQDVVILNEKNAICECAGSNIFTVRKNTLITPALQTGCCNDTLREQVLKLAIETGLKTEESENIKKEDLLQMDEIFTVSEETGFQWILGIENKRFLHNYSTEIHAGVNNFLEKKVR